MTVIDFALVTPGAPVEARPDLGIGRNDVIVKGRRVTVTVHSLGAAPATAGRVSIEGRGVAATAPIPPLAAPTDLAPKTATVTLTIPAGVDPDTLTARVTLADNAAEVTQQNNAVALADRVR